MKHWALAGALLLIVGPAVGEEATPEPNNDPPPQEKKEEEKKPPPPKEKEKPPVKLEDLKDLEELGEELKDGRTLDAGDAGSFKSHRIGSPNADPDKIYVVNGPESQQQLERLSEQLSAEGKSALVLFGQFPKSGDGGQQAAKLFEGLGALGSVAGDKTKFELVDLSPGREMNRSLAGFLGENYQAKTAQGDSVREFVDTRLHAMHSGEMPKGSGLLPEDYQKTDLVLKGLQKPSFDERLQPARPGTTAGVIGKPGEDPKTAAEKALETPRVDPSILPKPAGAVPLPPGKSGEEVARSLQEKFGKSKLPDRGLQLPDGVKDGGTIKIGDREYRLLYTDDPAGKVDKLYFMVHGSDNADYRKDIAKGVSDFAAQLGKDKGAVFVFPMSKGHQWPEYCQGNGDKFIGDVSSILKESGPNAKWSLSAYSAGGILSLAAFKHVLANPNDPAVQSVMGRFEGYHDADSMANEEQVQVHRNMIERYQDQKLSWTYTHNRNGSNDGGDEYSAHSPHRALAKEVSSLAGQDVGELKRGGSLELMVGESLVRFNSEGSHHASFVKGVWSAFSESTNSALRAAYQQTFFPAVAMAGLLQEKAAAGRWGFGLEPAQSPDAAPSFVAPAPAARPTAQSPSMAALPPPPQDVRTLEPPKTPWTQPKPPRRRPVEYDD
ncbi:MAG: hypothetical protein WC728_01785 [Elusimicrobiota bacterium]